MHDYIFAVVLLILLGVITLGITKMFFDDTDTFRVIDEKIAKLIRGKEDEAIEKTKYEAKNDWDRALEYTVELWKKEQTMSDDLIKRNSVIATIGRMYEVCTTGDITDYRDLMLESIKVLPSADRPQGEWTDIYQLSTDGRMTARCKNCREKIIFRDKTPNYCPNCGYRMKGEGDERSRR